MKPQSHIINKQLIEVVISDESTSLESQQRISQLNVDELLPILNRRLDVCFGDAETHYQIDKLTIDLGSVSWDTLPQIFDAALQEKLIEIQSSSQVNLTKTVVGEASHVKEEKTPLRILAYYLETGRLPWWLGTQKKSYLQEQWQLLMQNPTNDFKTLLSQLHHNHIHLERYLQTFSEVQVLQAATWITEVSEEEIRSIIKKIEGHLFNEDGKQIPTSWKPIFLKTLYSPKRSANTSARDYYVQETLNILGVDNNDTTKGDISSYKWLRQIRSVLRQYHQIAPHHHMLKQITRQLDVLLKTPAIYTIPKHLIYKTVALLEGLKEEIRTSKLYRNKKSQAFLERLQEETSMSPTHFDKKNTRSEVWTPLISHITTLEKIVKQAIPETSVNVVKLQSQLEDADFITIDNAGLILFWPFLPRFFENLRLLENKVFLDESAQHKAICALQYLCNPEESEFFEGQLSLPKVLCGFPLDQPVPPVLLTDEEKETAHGLMRAVLLQVPYWKNLSLEGFRSSYVCRQASFRTRDDHWVIQVEKETYDITLEKLPWSIQAVKLPWMERALMVEWL
ncbi:contractile injection system tape measure protein [Aquimarina rubra]|uniref:Contractile injection system tape measure protein n=1 Tax=Aquimarina rubra TaxID=1920033 RepID=A0ABW5LH86_9FLAO